MFIQQFEVKTSTTYGTRNNVDSWWFTSIQ